MKKILILLFCLCIFVSGCTPAGQSQPAESSPPASQSTPNDQSESAAETIVMFDAQPLPATITVKNHSYNVEYEVVVKDVIFRELTALEKEKSYQTELGYMAIVRYSAKSLNSSYSNELFLGEEFALVMGDTSYTHINKSITLAAEEYTIDDEYSDGYYQGYLLIEISEQAAASDFTQLRYIAKGSSDIVYYNLR